MMETGGSPEAFLLERLKHRRQFLNVASSGLRWVTPGLVLQVRRSAGGTDENRHNSTARIRLGFTTSKKVGNAVKRNRARRRLKAVAAAVMPTKASADFDYVLIGRGATVNRPYQSLVRDLETALKRLKARRQIISSSHSIKANIPEDGERI